MAWADGWVSRAERQRILELAKLHGVELGTPAYAQLLGWLSRRPRDKFFEGTWVAIQAILRSLPAAEREARIHALVKTCHDVAETSGALFHKISAAERRLLEDIEKQLSPQHETVPLASMGR
jgi:hypothetical protein